MSAGGEQCGRDKSLLLDTIPKTLGAAGIILYISGLVGVNAYLAPFGVTEFALFKPQFVYTGALVLAPIAIAAFALAVGLMVPEKLRIRNRFKGAVIVALVTATVACAIMTVLLSRSAHRSFGKALTDSAKLHMDCIPLVFAGYIAHLGRRTWSEPASHRDVGSASTPVSPARAAPRVAVALLLVGVAMFFANLYLGRFADDVYPSVARQSGGGKPFTAVLALTTLGADEARALNIPMDSKERTLSNPLTIAFEGSDFYLLCLPPTSLNDSISKPCIAQSQLTAVKLNKDLVTGVLTQGKGR